MNKSEEQFYRNLSPWQLAEEIQQLETELLYLEDAENYGDEYDQVGLLLDLAEEIRDAKKQ